MFVSQRAAISLVWPCLPNERAVGFGERRPTVNDRLWVLSAERLERLQTGGNEDIALIVGQLYQVDATFLSSSDWGRCSAVSLDRLSRCWLIATEPSATASTHLPIRKAEP